MSRAKAQGVDVLSVTEHDCLDSWPQLQLAAEVEKLCLIPGIEVSSQWRGRGVHIVGLGIDPQSPKLAVSLSAMAKTRVDRAATIASALAKAGLGKASELLATATEQADGGSIGRPHFARALVASGQVKSLNQAFKRYLGNGKVGDVKQCWPELAAAVALIVEAGGIAVLAHPAKYELTRTKLCELIADFREVGGRAIEVVSGRQEQKLTDDLCRLAQQFELLASLGSDFHLPDQPWQELGSAGLLPDNLVPVWLQPEISRWTQSLGEQ